MSRIDDEAAGYTVAALLAGVLFVATVGVVIVQGANSGLGAEDEIGSTVAKQSSGDLADLLFRSPGQTLSGTEWDGTGGDDVSRLGLLNASGETLQFEKFDNLRLAKYDADGTDGHVNYPEAAEALGLSDSGLDFHIRAYPSLPGVRELLAKGYKDPNLAVAYIGNISNSHGASPGSPPSGLTATDFACAPGDLDTSVLNLTATVTNGGLGDTQFQYVFDVSIPGQDVRVENVGTVLAAGASETAWADMTSSSGADCSDITAAELEVTDPTGTLLYEFALGAPSPATDTGAPSTEAMVLRTTGPYFLEGSDVTFEVTGPQNNDLMDIIVRDGTDVKYQLDDVKMKDLPDPMTVSGLAAGTYVIEATHVATGTTVHHRALVVASVDEPAGYDSGSGPGGTTGDLSEWSEAAKKETEYVHTLIERFCPYYYADAAVTPVSGLDWATRCPAHDAGLMRGDVGDVFPHTWKDLEPALDQRLFYPAGDPKEGLADVNTTGIIIVGSGVNHQGLVHVKDQLAAWVDAGGTLIVFGSDDSNTQWMQSIFHLGIHSSNTGVATVHDEGNPVLHTPDDLSYDAYDNGQQFWKFTSDGTEELFTNIIADADETQTILSTSNAGSFGEGSLLVTSWYPYDLDRTGSGTMDLEGLKLVNNLIMLGYRTLYLDYGPPIPDGVEVTPAISKKPIDHPELGIVTLDLAVYVFPNGG